MEIDDFFQDKALDELKQKDDIENTRVFVDADSKSLFCCTRCGKEYEIKALLQDHERLCLPAPSQQEENLNVKSCGACGQTFKYTKRLKKHEFMHEGEAQLWCKHCVKYFSSKEDKELHRMKEHVKRKKKHKCKICQDLVFDTEEEYFVHINDTHKGKFGDYHMCSDCGKQFKTKSELTHHNKSKCGTIKQYACKVCNQKLMNAGSLHNHMLRHTVECSNMCGYCGKMFLTGGQLKVHERAHTQEKAFVCNVCGKGFCHRQSLITHSTLHTGVKPYQCENCGNSFSCVGNLIKHRRTHADTCGTIPLTSHRVNNPSTKMKVKINTPITSKLKTMKKEKEKEDKLMACKNKLQEKTDATEPNELGNGEEECRIEYAFVDVACNEKIGESLADEEPTTTEELLNEQKTEVDNDYSEDCDFEYVGDVNTKSEKSKSEADFEEFLMERGIVEETVERTCQYCGKIYTNMRLLFRHEKEHEGIDSNGLDCYKCSCCEMQFSTRDECKKHKQQMHADLLNCQECDKIFSSKNSLRSHCRWLHKGLPKKTYVYVCEKCGVQFKQKAFLNYHKKNNCGSGPIYDCHVCGKGFNSIHTRRSHLRIHDPKKKFLCKYCGKSFRWKGQLKVHERSHTGEKPFKCLYCPKAFGYRESLITHSSLHTGIKPHLCQACGSRFSCIGNLIKHRTTHASTCGVWISKN